MGVQGSSLLLLTFAAGAGAGLVVAISTFGESAPSPKVQFGGLSLFAGVDRSKTDDVATGARDSSEPTVAADEAEAVVVAEISTPEDQDEDTLDGEDAVADAEDEETLRFLGRSAADVLIELELAYQERTKARSEELESLTESAEPSTDIEEVRPQLADLELPETEAFQAEETPESPPQHTLLAARSEADEGSFVQIQNGGQYTQNQYTQSSTQQTVVVQNVSPVFYLGTNFNTQNASTPSTPAPTQTSNPFRSEPWASSASRTNPWAPIDYSSHHNPYSSNVNGRDSGRPTTGGTGFTLTYRR